MRIWLSLLTIVMTACVFAATAQAQSLALTHPPSDTSPIYEMFEPAGPQADRAPHSPGKPSAARNRSDVVSGSDDSRAASVPPKALRKLVVLMLLAGARR